MDSPEGVLASRVVVYFSSIFYVCLELAGLIIVEIHQLLICICTFVLITFKVGESDGPDGYEHFLACSEWWTLKTPFYQFYSKNYSNAVMPFLEELRLSSGHATGLGEYSGKKQIGC